MDKQSDTHDTALIITEDVLRDKARAYVPMREKMDYVSAVSVGCFDRMDIGAATASSDPVPPMYKESAERKARYMASALCRLYLQFTFDPATEADPWMMSDPDYEYFCSGNPLNQIERVKRTTKDRDLQNKCYDLLADYKLLEKLLNSECYGLLHAMNDTLSRFQQMMSAQVTPEAVQSMVAELNELKAAFDGLPRMTGGSESNGE